MTQKTHGFTLIELMITVAIIGILAAIAYPMYIDKVRTARRVDAKTALLAGANREEQYYTTQHRYTTSLSDLGINSVTDNKAYTISASVSGNDDQKFTLTAKAQRDQRNDKCVTYAVDEIGRKTAADSLDQHGTDVSGKCW